jgi:hypothetical protein
MKHENIDDVIIQLRRRYDTINLLKYLTNLTYEETDYLSLNDIVIRDFSEEQFENNKKIFIEYYENELKDIDELLESNNIVVE